MNFKGEALMMEPRDIRNASEMLKGKVIRTPLVYSPTFSKMSGLQVYLKLENLQETGSFKLRGATVKIQSHRDEIGPLGVVAASAGNHAQGVALAARRAGVSATIVMPRWASLSKQEATRGYGGEVILEGQSIGDSIRRAQELAKEGRIFIHPFDDPEIIAGQGTIGLEILEDLPDTAAIIVPVGGGGLISGIAVWAGALRPDIEIIGVQASACPSAYQACRDGTIVRVEAERSVADGISVKQIGEMTYGLMRDRVRRIVLVEEDQIASAILMLLERKKVIAEGAGAVPLAALLSGELHWPEGSKVVLVISGGNVDSPLLDRILRQGLFLNERIMRFSVCLEDVPGALAGLLEIISRLRANVLHIYHDRTGKDMPVHLSRVLIELETRGRDHTGEVLQALKKAGYAVGGAENE